MNIPFLSNVEVALHNLRFEGRFPVFATSPEWDSMYLEYSWELRFRTLGVFLHTFGCIQVFDHRFMRILDLVFAILDWREDVFLKLPIFFIGNIKGLFKNPRWVSFFIHFLILGVGKQMGRKIWTNFFMCAFLHHGMHGKRGSHWTLLS